MRKNIVLACEAQALRLRDILCELGASAPSSGFGDVLRVCLQTDDSVVKQNSLRSRRRSMFPYGSPTNEKPAKRQVFSFVRDFMPNEPTQIRKDLLLCARPMHG